MEKYNFFLSYSASDGEEIARELSVQLREKGYTVFWAFDSMTTQSNYVSVIVDAISNCDYFIPIITQKAAESKHVLIEIDLACQKATSRATGIIPIVAVEKLPMELSYYLGHLQMEKLDTSVPVSASVKEIVERIDCNFGYQVKSALLYEKLVEYQRLGHGQKEAETICQLLRLIRENLWVAEGKRSDVWKQCEETLNLYSKLSKYVGGYDQESRDLAHKILNELDGTYRMLQEYTYVGSSPLFSSDLLFSSVAIRLVWLDREIRSECADVLSYGDVQNPCPIKGHIERQQAFVDAFRRKYPNLHTDIFSGKEQQFIEETKQFILVESKDVPRESVFEKEVYSALVKCGYSVEAQFRLNRFTVDLAIKKNGRYVLFIECASSLGLSPKALESRKELNDYITAIGSQLAVIFAEDWAKDPQQEIDKIKRIVDADPSDQDDELLVSIAKFIHEGNRLFDVLQKDGLAGDFLECLRESYERLKNYCVIVGANDIAAECAERIVEIRNEGNRPPKSHPENDKAEKGIKSLLGFTLEDSGKYDVFISFKSEDADLAGRIYEYCHRRMKEPFWSKKSLPRLSKSEYSKAINNALDNSKHFIVVLSNLEYLQSNWVKYEMEQFDNEIKEGRKKDSNFVIVATDDVYDQIIRSNKKVLELAYRRYQIIKMSEYEETLAQYIS